MLLATLKNFLDDELAIDDFTDDASLNGLQVEGSGKVSKITLAVDACDLSIKKAAGNRSNMLIVHHGLFWGGREPITGILKRRIARLLKNGISLYAAHLPLDFHREIGNNAQIASMLKMKDISSFGNYMGKEIGVCGKLPRPVSTRGLSRKINRLLKTQVKSNPFGPSKIEKLAIVSGSGASLASEAAKTGCDALLTGESSHAVYHPSREEGITLLYAGHYATETPGVKALGKLLEKEFNLKTTFVDIPTGL
ncbi:MAG: Nif3-like dinuclear metal center hexameric protein [Candidatus Krumholzibacteriota bacterium]|nr:Nif3-like dinuclear metal center hexameric protein [Candidatus Krumholzibacteriota bacterium]